MNVTSHLEPEREASTDWWVVAVTARVWNEQGAVAGACVRNAGLRKHVEESITKVLRDVASGRDVDVDVVPLALQSSPAAGRRSRMPVVQEEREDILADVPSAYGELPVGLQRMANVATRAK